MQIKTAIGYHLTQARMSISKNPQTINAREGVERRKPSYTVGGNLTGTASVKNSMEFP